MVTERQRFLGNIILNLSLYQETAKGTLMEHVPVDENKYVTMFLGFPDCFFGVYVVSYLKA